MKRHNKLILIILDGWGHGKVAASDAIQQANTPYIGGLYADYPNAELVTFGPEVGLPEGQMGNSEVGHLNIGAGRIVFQELLRIHNAVDDGSFFQHPVLESMFADAKKTGRLHLMGLVSDGGIHSHTNHLKALCQMAMKRAIPEVYIHAFTDGRDTDPNSGREFLAEIEKFIDGTNIKIASVTGRYFAMDRDKRWERIRLAYDAMVHGTGERTLNMLDAVDASYANDVSDEFIKPIVQVDADGNPLGVIQENDTLMCFNFRTDRCRQISEVLTQVNHDDDGMKTIPLSYYTMTEYDAGFKNVNVVYSKDNLQNTLGEVLEQHGKSQLRIAETEKYPHVTFFFSGGRESEFEKETRTICPSQKVATYDLAPEMSAGDVRDQVIQAMKGDAPDFICLNFANPDMVGHTGDFQAAVKAVEMVDASAKAVMEVALENDYAAIIIADHGNADMMINPDGSPNTAHTTNLVPIFVVGTEATSIKDGKLADVAPTILHLMGIDIPEEMTGNVLV